MEAKRIVATIYDDDGETYELSTTYTASENPFEVIEQEAKERGIRYVDTIGVYFPDWLGGNNNE